MLGIKYICICIYLKLQAIPFTMYESCSGSPMHSVPVYPSSLVNHPASSGLAYSMYHISAFQPHLAAYPKQLHNHPFYKHASPQHPNTQANRVLRLQYPRVCHSIAYLGCGWRRGVIQRYPTGTRQLGAQARCDESERLLQVGG